MRLFRIISLSIVGVSAGFAFYLSLYRARSGEIRVSGGAIGFAVLSGLALIAVSITYLENDKL